MTHPPIPLSSPSPVHDLLLEILSDGVLLYDGQGQALFANAQAACLLDCELAALRREPLAALARRAPDLAARMQQVAAAGPGRAEVFEVVLGPRQHCQAEVRLRSFGAVPAGVVAVLHEITRERQHEQACRDAERRYRAIVNDQDELICRFTPAGILTFVNDAYCRALRLSRQELLGTSWLRFLSPADGQRYLADFSALTPGNPVGSRLYQVSLPGGGVRWREWRQRAFFDEHGQVVEYQAVGRDITERQQAHDELERRVAARTAELREAYAQLQREIDERKKTQAQLCQAEKMSSLGVLAGGIAHELRNPLSVISACAQLLQQNPQDPELAREGIQRIALAANRGATVLSRMLRFAHPQDGLESATFDLAQLLNETLDLMAANLHLRQIVLERQVPALPLLLNGQAGMLQQAIINLVINAMDAMPEGGTLAVALRQEPGEALVVIRDSGHGIDPAIRERIFDPFFTTRPPGQGLGLGLAITYGIVSQHQGYIGVESQPGQGSTFSVHLPLPPEPPRA